MHIFEQGENLSPTENLNVSESIFDDIGTNLTNTTEYSNAVDTAANVLPSLELVVNESSHTNFSVEQVSVSPRAQAQLVDKNNAASEFALEEFDNMDSDRDGYLSNEELEEYEKTNDLTLKEKELVDVLKNNNDEWQKRSNDEYFFENNGVSEQDLARPLLGKAMMNMAENDFDEIDSNGDGVIKRDEIEEYVIRNETNAQEQEAAKLLASFGEMSTSIYGFNPFGSAGLSKEQAQGIGQSIDQIWKNN